jgi:predicted phosphoribosyltransferase
MFKDRKDAGNKLGDALMNFKHDHPLIVGIARGGLETAYYVAQKLDTDMVPIISRKLGYPFNPEFAMGAVSEDGSLYLSPMASSHLSESQLHDLMEREKPEIARRVNLLRHGKPLPSMKGKTVILVDDGIATGATLFATIECCKKLNPSKLLVAAPIGDLDTIEQLQELVDKIIVLETPPNFHAVSQGYEFFQNLDDEEALEFILQQEKTS